MRFTVPGIYHLWSSLIKPPVALVENEAKVWKQEKCYCLIRVQDYANLIFSFLPSQILVLNRIQSNHKRIVAWKLKLMIQLFYLAMLLLIKKRKVWRALREFGEENKNTFDLASLLRGIECAEFFVRSDSKWFIIPLHFELTEVI